MFERPQTGENVILIHIDLNQYDSQDDLREFQLLAKSSGANILTTLTAVLHKPVVKYFIGQGKAEEIAACVKNMSADLVIFNHSLSPAQERNLERLLHCRVVDRVGLILDIFAQRARTFEGKLQVELAQLQHLSTRLIRGWTHLERQKGGIGLRGPGESQLETDRRIVRTRISVIKQRLQKVRLQRQQNRAARKKIGLPVISLVGYTNAGKSTVFNRLTQASVYVADQLFATLDPTIRRIDLAEIGACALADTVGFIRHLPHDLVESFRATLDETREADLLLHVIDARDSARVEHIEQVYAVLKEIGASNIPTLEVFNKVDLLDNVPARIEYNKEGVIERVWLSAMMGVGLEYLQRAITERLCHNRLQQQIRLSANQGKLRASLYSRGAVIAEEITDDGDILLTIRMGREEFERLSAVFR
jgi:GTPase